MSDFITVSTIRLLWRAYRYDTITIAKRLNIPEALVEQEINRFLDECYLEKNRNPR